MTDALLMQLQEIAKRRAYLVMLLHKAYRKEFKDINLTRESGGLLYAIKEGDLSQAELADRFHITEASLSGRISRLKRDGYLNKVPDPKDHRKYRLELTDKANQELGEVEEKIARSSRLMFKGFTDEDLKQIHHYYKLLCHNLEEIIEGETDAQA